MEPWAIWQKQYGDFTNWRVRLYDAIVRHQLSYDALHTLSGDLRQALERVETEMLITEERERRQDH